MTKVSTKEYKEVPVEGTVTAVTIVSEPVPCQLRHRLIKLAIVATFIGVGATIACCRKQHDSMFAMRGSANKNVYDDVDYYEEEELRNNHHHGWHGHHHGKWPHHGHYHHDSHDGSHDSHDGSHDSHDGPHDSHDGPRDHPEGPHDHPHGPHDHPHGPHDHHDHPHGPHDHHDLFDGDELVEPPHLFIYPPPPPPLPEGVEEIPPLSESIEDLPSLPEDLEVLPLEVISLLPAKAEGLPPMEEGHHEHNHGPHHGHDHPPRPHSPHHGHDHSPSESSSSSLDSPDPEFIGEEDHE